MSALFTVGVEMFRRIFLSVATLALLIAMAFAAEQPIKRTVLQKLDYPQNYQTITAISEVPAGADAPRHTHPGVETSYVMEGEGNLSIAGQPDRVVKAGDSFSIPDGAAHTVHNMSNDKPFKVLTTYVVQKDKPLATPAPK